MLTCSDIEKLLKLLANKNLVPPEYITIYKKLERMLDEASSALLQKSDLTNEELTFLMSRPEYWRDQDMTFVEKVRTEYRKRYNTGE